MLAWVDLDGDDVRVPGRDAVGVRVPKDIQNGIIFDYLNRQHCMFCLVHLSLSSIHFVF